MFIDLNKNTTYALGEYKDNGAAIDAAFLYQDNNGGALLCSSDAPAIREVAYYNFQTTIDALLGASVRNTTKFKKLTGVTYADITADYVNGLTITSEVLTSVGTLKGNGVAVAKNDLVAFETADGTKGVLNITAYSATAKTLANITFDYKVQKTGSAK